jgi:hypothetical protein
MLKKARWLEMSNLPQEMIKIADAAVEAAEKIYNVKLDYSEESIIEVEGILNSLHEERPKNFITKLLKRKPLERLAQTAALTLGAYLGEVIRRIHGGEWVREDFAGEKDVLMLKIGETSIFPNDKVYKRITNGAEDDVRFYYKVLSSEFLKEKGTQYED